MGLLEQIKKPNAKAFTHSGKFHADDVFSSALLLYLNPQITITRGNRVPEEYDGIVFVIDLYCRIIGPGDGIVQAIADCIHRSVGFTKNCFDVLNVTITIVISLVCTGRLHGIGIGTVLAVILVGRTIAVFNHFTKEKRTALAGIESNT